MTRPVDKYDRAILAAASNPGARLRQLSEAAPGLCQTALNRRANELVRQGMLRMTTDGPRGPIFETTTKGLHALRSDQ